MSFSSDSVRCKERPLLGGIEAGGTKFVCAVGSAPDDIRETQTFPTTEPEKTLPQVIDFFQSCVRTHGAIKGLGLGCFGPVDIDQTSTSWGQITTTPKPNWSGVNIVKVLSEALGVAIEFDTDVNAALLAEATLGAGRNVADLVYVTIGTGIGGALMSGGRAINGSMHPEIGHMQIAREEGDTEFEGSCLFHGAACLEGLASGPAITVRWKTPAHELGMDHSGWELQSKYLATMCANLALILSPRRIILGGGVMQQPHLFPMIRSNLQQKLAYYLPQLNTAADFEQFVVPAELGQKAGIFGAILMAQRLTLNHSRQDGFAPETYERQ